MSVDYAKLKTNLNLIMHRLKLVEKKKMELNQKARRTIGEFLNAGKVDRARIRVEQIIREDYVVEAMDLVESYCDFLLSRFGQLKVTETVDEGLATAISSLIWVMPHFESDVPELRVIGDQLGKKYGKPYVMAVRENQMKTVNETLMKKLSVQAPPRILVEKYLVEIAKDQKIDYKPDPKVLKEQESLNSTGFRGNQSSDDDESGGGRQRGTAPQSGFNLIDLGDHYPRNPMTQPFNPYDQPPPLPSEPPYGNAPTNPIDSLAEISGASAPSADLPIGFNIRPLDVSNSSGGSGNKSNTTDPSETPSTSSKHQPTSTANSEGPPPNYDSVVSKHGNASQYYSFAQEPSFGQHSAGKDELDDTLPELPPVPKESGTSSGPSNLDDKLDLEDLTRRFEDLKNTSKKD